ncbi:MAG TPA: HAD-IIA family hydrolase [Acholeplasmataceae bacterium]|jgi:4-nitrophenyl phosphatase|nr:HAD-IIA family hydrolase [Acholeplasmataceae bacterium]
MQELKNIVLFLMDMDGTLYLENELIPGARDFIYRLIEKKKNYVFITNNSSVNKNNYFEKLKRLDIPCKEKNLFSSGMATGTFLKTQRKGRKVYLVGTKALEEELLKYGVELVEEGAEIVLVGYDRELTYKKLEKACYFLDEGAEFLATNADYLFPLKRGRFLPDCASICMMLTKATGKHPVFIGKPNRYMVDLLREKHGLSKHQVAIIGDRLYTDVACGKNAGITSILVLSGETKVNDLKAATEKPDYVFPSLKEIIEYIQ